MAARTSRLETIPQQMSLADLATAIRRRTRDLDVIELCDRVLGIETAPRSEVLARSAACAAPDERVTTPRVTTSRRVTTAKAPRVTTLDGSAAKPRARTPVASPAHAPSSAEQAAAGTDARPGRLRSAGGKPKRQRAGYMRGYRANRKPSA
jgi:hypothetical protein